MRNYLVFLSVFIFVSTFSQSNLKESLKPIKDNYKRINSINSWKKIIKVELHNATEGGEAKLYFSKNGLEKITALYFGETGKTAIEFYLDNYQHLTFVYEVITNYNMHIAQDNFNTDNAEVTEIRSYFQYSKIIKQINSKTKVILNKDFLNSETIRINTSLIDLLIETQSN